MSRIWRCKGNLVSYSKCQNDEHRGHPNSIFLTEVHDVEVATADCMKGWAEGRKATGSARATVPAAEFRD
ncbi:hypothetical protein EYZ11_009338 [Aspergillus tanneri]|uniref:Uncharacterized protein n=1 Tax=Aspergillus tanneri TaxID=1220188 RepID=A0A4S3J844_9EURO|nr:hypothetical protein EYZ11_009338 [Aspergillus tanneri]